MTVIFSSQICHGLSYAEWEWNRNTGKVLVYNSWFWKTLELNEVTVIFPLN